MVGGEGGEVREAQTGERKNDGVEKEGVVGVRASVIIPVMEIERGGGGGRWI